MAIASVVNGELIQNTTSTTTTSTSSTSSSSSSSMDKDSFLQLLVAQMKYQDPLEPTSNTEYVSQYAQFSELEAMQNLSSNMDLQRATELVGKEVVVNATTGSGDATLIQGRVDYVKSEGSKILLSIDDELYNLDDLDRVIDGEYYTALDLSEGFSTTVNSLPNISNLTTGYRKTIENLSDIYNSMSVYQKSYLNADDVTKFKEYESRMKQLVAIEEAENNKSDS